MSKINELRRKATEAARKRDWKYAVKLYERVCEIDSANASFRNELGDIYLKMGDVHDALDAFRRAAELYRSVSLHNNAIAVLKKILRHDKNHLDATWGLGEVRGAQGLDLEAQQHYVEFLDMANQVDGVNRDKFTNRCVLLVEKYGDDLQMLSRVESVFEAWSLAEDHARVLMQKGRLAHDEGQGDLVDKYIEKAREIYPELDSLDDYIELISVRDGVESGFAEPAASGSVAMPNDGADAHGDYVDLDGTPPAEQVAAEPEAEESSEEPADKIEFELDEADLPGPADGLEFEIDTEEGEEASAAESPGGGNRAAAAVGPSELSRRIDLSLADDSSDGAMEASDSVNLLDELLADGGAFDLAGGDERQVESIETDLGDQIASQVAPDDYAGQYDVGVVYMEMGLYDQASEAFGRASCGPEQRLKALEMQGSCLRRSGRNGEALAAFQDGLNTEGEPERHFLGLLYEAGICYEEMGNPESARTSFERAASIDAGFRDVAERIQRLVAPAS